MKWFYEVDKEMVSHVSDKICTGMVTAFLDTYHLSLKLKVMHQLSKSMMRNPAARHETTSIGSIRLHTTRCDSESPSSIPTLLWE
jgi:hypothetical protein